MAFIQVQYNLTMHSICDLEQEGDVSTDTLEMALGDAAWETFQHQVSNGRLLWLLRDSNSSRNKFEKNL